MYLKCRGANNFNQDCNKAEQTAGGSNDPALTNVVTMATATLVTASSILSFVSQKELAVNQLYPPSLQISNHKNMMKIK